MTTSTTPEKKKAPIRRLTVAERAEAIALWKAGTVTLDDLAERYKKDRSTFVRLFAEAGVTKGSDKAETERRVKEAVASEVVDEATLRMKRARDLIENNLKYVNGLQMLAWNLVVTAQKEKRPPASYANDMKALEMATRVFASTRKEGYVLLKIREDDEGDDKELPTLTIQELTAQDITELHERSLMAEDELGLDKSLGDEEILKETLPDDEGNERVEVDD